jgi:N6-adenosine-specific RNA methylase IME4
MSNPRRYSSNAERQAAYRERKRIPVPAVVHWLEDLIAQGAQFRTIYADPPWKYKDARTMGAAARHYQTMSLAEIAALPVAQLAAKNSHCHLWTTTSFQEASYALLRGWGFEPKSELVWCKPSLGTGHYWRGAHEKCLLGVKGHATFRRHDLKSWFECGRGAHSSKPEQVRHWIEQASPGPYLELFGRRPVLGWTVFGNAVSRDLFSPSAGEA